MSFWDNLVRTLAGANAGTIGPVQPYYPAPAAPTAPGAYTPQAGGGGVGPVLAGPAPAPAQEPGFLGRALAGWRGMHQNPEARQVFQDFALGLMATNTGNPFTDLAQGIAASRGALQGRIDSETAAAERDRTFGLDERKTAAYESQVRNTAEIAEGNRGDRRAIAKMRDDTQRYLGQLRYRQALDTVRAKEAAAKAAGRPFNFYEEMIGALEAEGYTKEDAVFAVAEHRIYERQREEGAVDELVREGRPRPTPPGVENVERLRKNAPGAKKQAYPTGSYLKHTKEGVRTEVTGFDPVTGNYTIKHPKKGESQVTPEQMEAYFEPWNGRNR